METTSVKISGIKKVDLYRQRFIRATVAIELREYDLGPPNILSASEAETLTIEVLVPENQLGSDEEQEIKRASVTRAHRLCEAAVRLLEPWTTDSGAIS